MCLLIGFKAQRRKRRGKKRKKEKEKKEMKLGLDPNEGRRECEMCEWCNWALSKRRKHEFWKTEFCPR